jgi:hypothetical protein
MCARCSAELPDDVELAGGMGPRNMRRPDAFAEHERCFARARSVVFWEHTT